MWYIYTVEYYSAIKRNVFESVLMRWRTLEPIIQREVSQKEKDKYCILMHILYVHKYIRHMCVYVYIYIYTHTHTHISTKSWTRLSDLTELNVYIWNLERW